MNVYHIMRENKGGLESAVNFLNDNLNNHHEDVNSFIVRTRHNTHTLQTPEGLEYDLSTQELSDIVRDNGNGTVHQHSLLPRTHPLLQALKDLKNSDEVSRIIYTPHSSIITEAKAAMQRSPHEAPAIQAQIDDPRNVNGYWSEGILDQEHMMQMSDKIHHMNQAYLNQMSVDYPNIDNEKNQAIPWGIKLDQERYPTQDKSILYAGRFTPDKGFHNLLAAIPGILEEHSDAQINIAGGTLHEIERAKQTLAHYGVSQDDPRVGFHGWISDKEEMKRIIGQNSTYICASPDESFGLSIVEAAESGLVPLYTDTASLRSTFSDKGIGLTLPDNSPRGITQGVSNLFSKTEQERYSLAQMSREGVATHYNEDKVMGQFYKLYADL